MNKSQKLAVMRLRAKIKTKEIMTQHQQSWHGQEPKLVKDVKKGAEDALQATR